jgi:hypothetical protein
MSEEGPDGLGDSGTLLPSVWNSSSVKDASKSTKDSEDLSESLLIIA